MSEAADNSFNFCIRLIKISIIYMFPVVSAGLFICFSWRGYSFPTRAASFRVRQPSNAPFVLSYQPTEPRLPCGYCNMNMQINFAIQPIFHFRQWLGEFFSLFQRYEFSITLSINLLRNYRAFHDSPLSHNDVVERSIKNSCFVFASSVTITGTHRF